MTRPAPAQVERLYSVEECDAQIGDAEHVMNNPDDFPFAVRVDAGRSAAKWRKFRAYAAELVAVRAELAAVRPFVAEMSGLANDMRGVANPYPDDLPGLARGIRAKWEAAEADNQRLAQHGQIALELLDPLLAASEDWPEDERLMIVRADLKAAVALLADHAAALSVPAAAIEEEE